MFLETPIQSLPSTRPITIKKLSSLGIRTYFDLLRYVPFRYEDYSLISPIARIQEGEKVTIRGTVESAKNQYTRRRLTIQRVILADESGSIPVVWFNQPYIIRLFPVGAQVALSGSKKKDSFEPKEYEIIKSPDQISMHTGKLVPVYLAKKGLSARTIREKVFYVLTELLKTGEKIPEMLPPELVKRYNLASEDMAFKTIHQPLSTEDEMRARERLSFDEFFTIQLSAYLVRKNWEKEKVGNILHVDRYKKEINEFVKTLPFALTDAQIRAKDVILTDLGKPHPMNRFLQGDVGSGKTVIAAIAAYASYLNGFRTLVMAPTEILTMQHFATLEKLFKNTTVSVGLQTGSQKKSGTADIIVGTHALVSKKANFADVGLVVVDEQHRFGVRQRGTLKEKGQHPHLLSMTATPIPRTVALTLYGELDMTVLNEMPKGRIPIKSYLTPDQKRADGYSWIFKKVTQEGAQVFVICPLIEESTVETMKSVKAVTKEYEYLQKDVFPTLKVGLIHGKLKAAEKNTVMEDFKNKKYDILVSTSVVEVGIDIPSATVIVIEGAERYGLAQLHQLRGRVGRGDTQSYCLVFTESNNPQVLERLSFFCKTTSGADLAEYDLVHRGAGDLYGTRQSGDDTLQIASFSDFELIERSKKAVEEFIEKYRLSEYPRLHDRIKELQIHQIAKD